jgi:phenylacetate-CoA ligase
VSESVPGSVLVPKTDRRLAPTVIAMGDYEMLRQTHVADAMATAPALIDQLCWDAERLAAHRERRLRELVGFAVERSPWHRDRLAGIGAGRLTEAGLGELPPMTKDDLMVNFDRILTDRRLSLKRVNDHLDGVSAGSYLLDRYTAITSGGSTGVRGVFVYDWSGWATFWAGIFRYLVRFSDADPELASRPVVWAWVAAAHFTHATAALSRTFASPRFVNHRFPVTLPTDEIVDGLNRVQPDFLNAYPSILHVLAHEALAGRLRITPRRVSSAAEPLLPEIRAVAEEAWGMRVGNLWGTSEGGPTGIPCDDCGTHLSDDLLIVEAVDEDGLPVAPGQRSAKIYLTNLYNFALPLIRYEITDEVTILPERCSCGSAHRCVADIQGRLDDLFFYEGRRIHPHLFRSALGRHAGIVEYQVRQTERGAAIAVRCTESIDSEALARELERGLSRHGVAGPEVTVSVVERLERDGGPAKLKRFVPLAPAAPATVGARG